MEPREALTVIESIRLGGITIGGIPATGAHHDEMRDAVKTLSGVVQELEKRRSQTAQSGVNRGESPDRVEPLPISNGR